MPLMRLVRPVVAGLFVAVLVTTAGCSKTAEKPDAARPPATTPQPSAPQASPAQAATPRASAPRQASTPKTSTPQPAREATAPLRHSTSKPVPAIEPPTMSKLPVAEFQHLPTAPPSEPLPKPTQEAMDPPGVESPRQPTATADARSEMPNPLREAEQAPVRPAPLVASAATTPSTPPTPSTPTTPSPAPTAPSPSPVPAAHSPSTATALTAPLPPPAPAASPSAPQAPDPPTAQPPKEKEAAQPLAGRPKTKKNSGIPFDPLQINGSIFDGWPKPKLALVITGMEDGYLEPCGCAGLDRMKGGMARRATFFQKLRQDGWPVLGLDVGGLIHGFGRQAELKFQTLVESKRKMGYEGIAFGADDLRLPAGELVAVAASVDGKPSPFLAANVGLLGKPGDITPQCRVIEAGGVRIGVTAVLGKKFQKEIHNDEIQMSDPDAVLAKMVAELKPKADYLVLLAHATLEEATELGKKFPAFNVVVSSGGWYEPPKTPQTIAGTKTLLITVGHKGMDAIVLGLYDGAKPSVRYQRVPLDSRFKGSPDMKLLMTAYQEQLKAIGFEGLGLRPVPHPQFPANGKFVGSQKCESCHEKSYEIWKKSGHAHAYNTIAKLDPPRNFDPECVSCHVVGWHPTKFFPYETGYQSQEKTPHLVNVGCEDCHGPGEKHVAAELSGSEALRKQLRKAMVLTKADAKKTQCVSCHDLDNSLEFNFDLYWPFVEHHEKD